MNDDFEIDELASAYLDDAATAEERALVDADPAIRARVEELRPVRNALAASRVEPPTTTTKDSAIASALAAAPVVDLPAARARRRLRIASIAAAVILVVGAAGLLLRSASSDSSKKLSATAAASSPASSATAQAASPEFPAANGVAGSYADREALVSAVQATLRSAQSTKAATGAEDNAAPTAAGSSTSSRCATTPADAATQLYTASAALEGAPVQIDVYALTDGTRRVVVTAAGTCTLVFTQPL